MSGIAYLKPCRLRCSEIEVFRVRVHQHAANDKEDGRSGCMCRSRGGPTTKIHALFDAKGPPMALKLTESLAE